MIDRSKRRGIVTIAGVPGSGTSSNSKALAKELGFTYFSSGNLMRELGAERQLHILDTNYAAATDEELDRIVDGTLQELGTHEDGVVVDSRLAWHWIPGSLKVMLDLPDPIIAATRILADMDPIRAAREHIPEDPQEYALQLVERQRLESARYKTKYGIDPFNNANYDLVINTEKNGPVDTVKLMMDAYRCMRLRRKD